MIGGQQLHVQVFAVIVHDHKSLVRGWSDDGRRKHILREMELGQPAGIVCRSVRKIAVNGVRPNRLWEIVEPVFKRRNAKSLSAVIGGSKNIQQEPKTGDQGDGSERYYNKLMARQADQFNTTGPREGARRQCWMCRPIAIGFPDLRLSTSAASG